MSDAAQNQLMTKVEEWLATQGYPLEMRVASTLLRHNAVTWQSQLFQDSETGKFREIDVLSVLDEYTLEAGAEAHVVVECKASPDKPWVLFAGATHSSDPVTRLRSLMTTRTGQRFTGWAAKRPDVRALPLFARSDPFCHGAVRAMGGQDVAYSALLKIVKAAESQLRPLEEQDAYDATIGMVVPIIVVDAPVFTYGFTKESKARLQRVQAGTVAVRGTQRNVAVVEIVSADALDGYVAGLMESLRFLLSNCQEENAGVTRLWQRGNDRSTGNV